MSMKKTYSEDDLRDILTVSIQNETVDSRITETLECIRQDAHKDSKKRRKRNKRTGWKKVIYGAGTIAAAVFIALCVCAANPSLAANIPVLGNIFARVQDVFPFGRLPEEETTKLEADNYQAQSQGITITFTEYYASNQAVFVGVRIENDEEFPEFATMGDGNYQLIQVSTQEEYSFRDTGISYSRDIEGRLEDPYTFVGVMRIDYDSIIVDMSRYYAAHDEAERKGEETPEIEDYYLDYYEVPEEFEMQMQILRLRGYSHSIEAEPESKYTVIGGTKFMVTGEWNCPAVKIQKSDKDVRTIQLDEVNEEGIGVEKIELSPVELTLHIVEPADRMLTGEVLDAEGKMLIGFGNSVSRNVYAWTTSGRDISTVSVYICDHDEYMDKIWGETDDEKIQRTLEEIALFKTIVTTTE